MFGRRSYQVEGVGKYGPASTEVEPPVQDYLHDIYSQLEEQTELLRAIRDAVEADK